MTNLIKTLLWLTICLVVFCHAAIAQVSSVNAKRLYSGTAVPTMPCSPGPTYRDIYVRTTTDTLYWCTAAPNTWATYGTGGGGGGATTALDNLAAVAINATLIPGTAGAADIGSATKPFGFVFLSGSSGTPGTNNFKIIGASTSGTRTVTLPDSNTLVPIASQALTFAGPTAARTITFPDAAITVARTDAANTFTGHQTIEGVTSTGATGTGKFVFDGTPTLVTPVIGAATGTSLSLTGNLSTGVGSGVAGRVDLTEGSATALVANTVSHWSVVDAPAAGSGYAWGAAAATGLLHVANSSGVMTVTQSAVDLAAADVTGILPAANGGTGINNSTRTLTVSTNAGTLAFPGAATTMTFPSTTATLARIDAANTFTGVQTFSSAPLMSTLTSGRVTFATASGGLTDDADLTFATDTLTFTKGAATTSLTVAGAAVTNNLVQNSQSTAYTTVLGDAGKSIYHPSADTTARTWTIDSNANVAYPIGTTLTFVNDCSAGVLTIAITSDVLVLAGAGTTGSRTIAACGIATAVKMTTTRWMINGTGLTFMFGPERFFVPLPFRIQGVNYPRRREI